MPEMIRSLLANFLDFVILPPLSVYEAVPVDVREKGRALPGGA